MHVFVYFFFFQAEDGIRDLYVTGVQTCALPISPEREPRRRCTARTCALPRRAASSAARSTMLMAMESSCIGFSEGPEAVSLSALWTPQHNRGRASPFEALCRPRQEEGRYRADRTERAYGQKQADPTRHRIQ